MYGFSPPWKWFYFSLVLSCKALNSTDVRGRYYCVTQPYLEYLKMYPSMPLALQFGCLSCTFPSSSNRCASWIVFKIVLQSTWDYFVLILSLLLLIFFKHFNLRDLAKLQLLKNYAAIRSFCFPFKLTFAKISKDWVYLLHFSDSFPMNAAFCLGNISSLCRMIIKAKCCLKYGICLPFS